MAARSVEPLGLFTYAALRAGWFFCWRLTVFTVPFWGGALLVAAGLMYFSPELAPVVALLVAAGFVAAFVASIPLTNRIARAWSLAWFERAMVGGVWWGIFWRVLVVSVAVGGVLTAVQVAAALFAATMPWSPMQLFVSMIPYAVMLASLVMTVRSYGWAMSIMVARRIGGVGSAAGSVPAAAPAAAVQAAPRPAPVPSRGAACPKCGTGETEQGSVIGRYCRVCGWRERRG